MKDNYDGKTKLITLEKAQIHTDSSSEAVHLSEALRFLALGLEGRPELKFTAKPNNTIVEIEGNINHLMTALCSGHLLTGKGASDIGKQQHDIRCPPRPKKSTSQQLEYVKRLGQKAEREKAEQVARENDTAVVPSNDSSGSTSPKKD